MPTQIPWIVLPQVWITGIETEIMYDLVTHPSVEFQTEYLGNKIIHITAGEVIFGGVPGPLWSWVEVSPVSFAVSDTYYSAIGGGGGPINPATGLPYIPPVVPLIEAGTGVMGTVHSWSIPWGIHSAFARLVIQTPAVVVGSWWLVQAIVSGR